MGLPFTSHQNTIKCRAAHGTTHRTQAVLTKSKGRSAALQNTTADGNDPQTEWHRMAASNVLPYAVPFALSALLSLSPSPPHSLSPSISLSAPPPLSLFLSPSFWLSVSLSLRGRFRTARAQRGHSANYYVVWGNVCPARARRATFLLTTRLQSEIYPLMEKAPQMDHDGLRTFPTKHVA